MCKMAMHDGINPLRVHFLWNASVYFVQDTRTFTPFYGKDVLFIRITI